MSDFTPRLVSALGFVSMIGIAWAVSSDRGRFPWRIVAAGAGLQITLGLILLKTAVGTLFFAGMNRIVSAFLAYTDAGTRFIFGPLADSGFSIFLNVLPIIVFSGCFFSVLYHIGIMQRVVDGLSAVLARTMRLSGAESLSAVANLFVGLTETALIVGPYVARMTRSELFTLMTLGMATVAGGVMLAYVGMLGGDYAGHLATASLLSAPAGILLSKVMFPETETPETATRGHASIERTSVNVIDAAASGTLDGLRLASSVGALLLAFVAMIALLNGVLGSAGALVGVDDLSMERILGTLLAPVAWLLGVPWAEASQVGAMLGIKTVLNEFLAYQQLAELQAAGALSPRASVIASYALCGFANFGSLAILVGGIGGIAPERRAEVAQLGMHSILAGSLATFMTACVAGMLL